METELRKAKNIALQTWGLIAKFYDQGVTPISKEDGTPVTEADKLANEYITESLQKAFPRDSIISEEDSEIKGSSGRTWYIDPIDGTKGFIKRNGHFAVHIGLAEKDQTPALGVVYWPVTGDLYSGVKDIGAWRENSRGILELKIKSKDSQGLIASSNGDFAPKGMEEFYRKLGVTQFHNCGSEGLRMMKLAENRADLRICESRTGTNTWDLCAPQAIVESAGGYVNFVNGLPVKYYNQRKLELRHYAASSRKLGEEIEFLIRNPDVKSPPGSLHPSEHTQSSPRFCHQ